MDVLNSNSPIPTPRRSGTCRRGALLALGVAAYLAVVACLAVRSPKVKPIFPHHVHTVDHQMACSTCHPSARSDADPGLPAPEFCAVCHDDLDQGKPTERTAAGLFDASGQWTGPKAMALEDEILFAHDVHVASGLDCAVCHPDPDAPRDPGRPLMGKPECMQCHESRGAPTTCATCHADVDRDWAPPSHYHNWTESHGSVARAPSDASVDDCSLCHEPTTSCLACHLTEPPRDHGTHFLNRGHGIAATIDRARCATCHTSDSCQQCHETTRPRSHRAGFGGTTSRHCVSCHLPVQETGCAVCHKGTPSHEFATPLPPGHVPSMNCRACHGAGQPLPHPDGGHVCTACHR